MVVGKDRERVAPAVAGDRPSSSAAPSTIAVQEQQQGTGHAVGCGLTALPADFTGTVVVTSGDVPLLDADTLADLIAAHSAESAAATVLTTTLPDPTGYGRILRTQDGEVIGIVEQADATPSQRAITEVNAGVYAFDIAALRSALSRLRSDNAQHELYLTDVISIVRSDGRIVRAKHVDDTALVAGVNDRVQLADAGRRTEPPHRRRRTSAPGVTIIDPATTWIDVDVTIGRDTVVQPGTQLLGATRIGGRCQIGPDTTLTDVTVGDGADGGPHPRHVVGRSATTPSSARSPTCGPAPCWAPTGKLGAFVETKNATIGDGHQGAAPDLRRRRRHRRAQQHRRVQRVRQLRRRNQAPHHDRLPRAHRFGHHVRRAGDRRRRRLHRRGHRGPRGRAARRAGRVGGTAAQHRGLGGSASGPAAPRRPRQPRRTRLTPSAAADTQAANLPASSSRSPFVGILVTRQRAGVSATYDWPGIDPRRARAAL